MKLIAFSGKMGVGKTTLAKLISPYRVAFADALKTEVAEKYQIPPCGCYEHKELTVMTRGKGTVTVREALRAHGTRLRAKDPNYWIQKLGETLRLLEWSGPPVVCVDDVRYRNEADWLKARGALLCRVVPYPEWSPGPHAGHLSETELDNYEGFDLILSPLFGDLPVWAEYVLGTLKT